MPFNLDVTLRCGQVFRWERRGEWWVGVVGNRVVKVRQTEGLLDFSGADEKFVKHYFSLDHDLERISREIGKDAYVKVALRELWGLRLVRQEPWECLISFICATYKNVAAIRQMLQRLAAKFGETVVFESEEFHGFPSAAKLAGASLEEIKACGLGYRAKYVLETSRIVADGSFKVDELRAMLYGEAKAILLTLPGVGQKVADCVLLFSLGKLEAFPVDVWVKRILLRHYAKHFDKELVEKLSGQGSLSDSQYEQLNSFGTAYFGGYAGYAQEYLYHFERCRVGDQKLEKATKSIPEQR